MTETTQPEPWYWLVARGGNIEHAVPYDGDKLARIPLCGEPVQSPWRTTPSDLRCDDCHRITIAKGKP